MSAIAQWADSPPPVKEYQIVHDRNDRTLDRAPPDAAWLLQQHFGNVDVQRQCLDLLLALPKADRDRAHYAFMFDLCARPKAHFPASVP